MKIVPMIEDLKNRCLVYLVIKEKGKMRKNVKRDLKKVKYTFFEL